MKNIIIGIIFIGISPLSVCAMSQDEQTNLFNIKNQYSQSDKELNELYKSQILAYKKEGGKFYGQNESRDVYLKTSQLAWIKMRDAGCDYETYESKIGTGFSSIYAQCLLDKTNERIKYLKENN